MRLVVENRKDHALAILGMCGQLERVRLEAMLEGSRERVSRDVASLIKDKYVRVAVIDNHYLVVDEKVEVSVESRNDFREMALLGLIGSSEKIKTGTLLEIIPEEEKIIKPIFNKLIKQNKIKIIDSKGIKVLRLTTKGVEKLKEIDKYLYYHYQNFTGGHRFNGSESFKKRMKKQTDLMRYFITQNMEVDFLKLEYKQNKIGRHKKEKGPIARFDMVSEMFQEDKHLFEKDGSLKNYDELLVLAEPHRQYFFSSKALRTITELKESKANRAMMYRIYGVMLGEYNYYPVYLVESGNEEWFTSVESEMKHAIEVQMESAWTTQEFKKRKRRFPDGSSITYLSDVNLLVEIMKQDGKEKKGKIFFPPSVYSGAHMLPMGENEKDIRELLLTREWDIKLNEKTFGKEGVENATKGDAKLGEALAWELLSCNMSKLVEINKFIEYIGEVILVVHSWQKPLVEKIFKSHLGKIKILEINEEEFRSILSVIKNT